MKYYISGLTSTKIEQFVDKNVKVTGKIVQTTDIPDVTTKIYYNAEKNKNGECKVNSGIDIAAVRIDSIAFAD